MYAITVAPIRRGFGLEELTYYHPQHLPLGSIVNIPLRSKDVLGIVLASRSVKEARADLRNADFALRKISTVHTDNLFSPLFISAVSDISHHYASTFGATLHALTPTRLLPKISNVFSEHTPHDSHEIQGIQDTRTTRYDYYRQVVRTSLALNQSVLIVAPTADVTHLEAALAKGITSKVIALHSGMTAARELKVWNQVVTSDDPIVLITTLQYACIPRKDFRIIILERESARAHTGIQRPYVNARTALTHIARHYGIPLILGDSLLTTTTRFILENDPAVHEPHRIQKRYNRTIFTQLVDMQPHADTFMSPEATELLDTLDHVCVFVSRRGVYPHTLCGDCGTPVRCTHCDTPVVVHGTTAEKRVFMCHKCHRVRSAKEYCSNCSSWKLVPLGVGSAKVAEDLATTYSKKKIIRIDSDATTTPRQAQKAYDLFMQTPGAILVCTEMGLPYLTTVPYVVIASLDSMFALPDYRQTERIARIILALTEATSDTCIYQTRNPDAPHLYEVLEGIIDPMYLDEIKVREQLNYPPFTTLIKCTVRGNEKAVEDATRSIEKTFAAYKPQTYPAFTPKIKNDFIVHTLFKVRTGEWPDAEIITHLKSLPQQVQVSIEPMSTL